MFWGTNPWQPSPKLSEHVSFDTTVMTRFL
jgi:hypothetical protein